MTPENNKESPSQNYLKFIEQGSISMDAVQFDVVQQLDQLKIDLLEKQQSQTWMSSLGSLLSAAPLPIKGYYLWGGVGTGKTLLMDTFFQSLPDRIASRTHFHRFMGAVHTRKNELGNVQNPLNIIATEYAAQSKLLCLDEFAITDITDAMIMSGLLNKLFELGVILVTTSNTPIQHLYQNGLQRERFLPAIALLETHTHCINVDSGIDYRMAFLQNNDIFHTPANTENHARLTTAFAQLSGANEQAPRHVAAKSISINSREVSIVNRSSGVVWFDFDSICRSHRSNIDFIEIAKRFHTVIISAIPTLTGNDDDATRRLIELIDELYDRNVNLLVSSDNIPNKIYTGSRLNETFKRTSSRLTEMSSHDYLAKPHLS
jgi:cell division protein ZapE